MVARERNAACPSFRNPLPWPKSGVPRESGHFDELPRLPRGRPPFTPTYSDRPRCCVFRQPAVAMSAMRNPVPRARRRQARSVLCALLHLRKPRAEAHRTRLRGRILRSDLANSGPSRLSLRALPAQVLLPPPPEQTSQGRSIEDRQLASPFATMAGAVRRHLMPAQPGADPPIPVTASRDRWRYSDFTTLIGRTRIGLRQLSFVA